MKNQIDTHPWATHLNIMRTLPNCPYCGKEKKFDCHCEYGSIMKIHMEPNEKQTGLFHKKFCPKCGQASTANQCKSCGFNFTAEDFWVPRFW